MGKISITKTNIKDLVIIEPQVFQDERGYFLETYNETDFQNEYPNVNFVQDSRCILHNGKYDFAGDRAWNCFEYSFKGLRNI